MATSTTPGIVHTPSFYAQAHAQSFTALAVQSIRAKRAAQEAAQQAAAQHAAATQNAAANSMFRQQQQRNPLAGSLTTAPSWVMSGPPPSTLTTQPPRSINTSHPGKPPPRVNTSYPGSFNTPIGTPRLQPKAPEKTWSFQSSQSTQSINSCDAEEELILNPKLERVSSTRITSQSQYGDDPTSILKGAFGDKLVTGKPFQVQQDSRGAMQQRAALRQDAPPSALHGLLMNRGGNQKIFLMRHGESEGNVSRYDVEDPNLTQIGQMQAKSWQEVVGEFGAEIVLVSPLRRTIQTACYAYSQEPVRFVLCRSAREFGWGCAENTICLEESTMDEMLRTLPNGHKIQGIHEALYPGLDDPMDEYESLDRLKLVLASRPESTIMVVCHYGVISALTGSRAKNGDVYECMWGGDDELKVMARHRNPLADQSCICG